MNTYFAIGKTDILNFAFVWSANSNKLQISRLLLNVNVIHPSDIIDMFPESKPGKDSRIDELMNKVSRFLAGEAVTLPIHFLDISQLSDFERKVLISLYENVPRGEVITYGQLASLSGYPRAARAVGSVMRKNPFPLFFPCHRVIRSDGTIGHFQPGPEIKRQLLDLEFTIR